MKSNMSSGAWNKAHFRNLMPNRFLPSSVVRGFESWSGGCEFKPHWGFDEIYFVLCNFFLKHFWRTWVLFVGPLIPLFWTSSDISPGFQSQGGSIACVLCHLHAMNSWDSPLVRHLPTSWRPAWRPVAFPTCYICSRGRILGFDQETSHTVSRRALHSATATGCSV